VAQTGVNAKFQNGAALRYPVWKVILDFANCSCHLEGLTVHTELEQSHLVLRVNSFAGLNLEWLALCPVLLYLP